MKLRLLKPLPGAEVGIISKPCSLNEQAHVIGNCSYDPLYLIAEGWAEEIKQPERWEPKKGEEYFELNFYGPNWHPISTNASYEEIETVKHKAKYGMVAKNKEQLETTLLLLKLRQSNGGWKPKRGDSYYHVTSMGVEGDNSTGVHFDTKNFIIGNCYRTREEAEKHAGEWKKLFDSVK